MRVMSNGACYTFITFMGAGSGMPLAFTSSSLAQSIQKVVEASWNGRIIT
jgi:hypothetical protein